MRDLPGQLLDLLASLELGPGSDVVAAGALARLEPVEAAHALAQLVAQGRRSPRGAHALMVLTRALEFAPEGVLDEAQRGRIYDAATEHGLPQVAGLFVRDAPGRELDPAAAAAPDPVIGHLTLGHKKMLARKVDGDRLARFALEPDPRVVREVLQNPRLTEDIVLRIASRRPARAAVLLELWRSQRWCARLRVRVALALNPYTPPDVSLKILPALALGDLRAAAADSALHASVREMAKALVARRLPARRALDQPAEGVAEPGEPAGEHHQDQREGDESDLGGGEVEAGHRSSDC